RPALNPRLNLDFTILKNKGPLNSLGLTAGTGLFSSINEVIALLRSSAVTNNFTMGPNRSWTSLLGMKIDFTGGYSFNIEGYFKYIFDRGYYPIRIDIFDSDLDFRFDSIGRVWGFDFQFQKFESPYVDGWLSYSFNHARYREEPEDGWFYPDFHRFHNFNLVLNIKPSELFHIALRFGFASGKPIKKVMGPIKSYPVLVLDKDRNPDQVIQKYYRETGYDDNERTTWSLPLDMKFSFYPRNRNSKVQQEIYLSVENLLSLAYRAQGNTTFNAYTGEEERGGNSAVYELPVPMVSFGFKWSY
ncbi:MAG: hypothetical protein LBL43_05655, partial [Treponema sp.]|nr:hypothetical protein [Treponema sp.]